MNFEPGYPDGEALPKPGIESAISNGFRKYKQFFGILVLISLVYTVFGFMALLPSYLLPGTQDIVPGMDVTMLFRDMALYFVFLVGFLIFYVMLVYGFMLAALKAARGEKPNLADLFRPFGRFFPVLFSAILLGLIIGWGFILLIVPGIFFAVRLAYVPYLIVDEGKGVFAAMEESWKLTTGHFWRVRGLSLIFLAVSLVFEVIVMGLTYAITGVNPFSLAAATGASASVPWDSIASGLIYAVTFGVISSVSFASLYEAIKHQKRRPPETEAIPYSSDAS